MAKFIAVIPVGAVEQHGPHLPVRVDAAINAGILQHAVGLMPEALPILLMPELAIGNPTDISNIRAPSAAL